jgi:hypothetical protein
MTPHETTPRRACRRSCMMGAAVLSAMALSGCTPTPIAEPGFAVLEVKVAAVPKKGMKSAQSGGPVAGGYGEVEEGPERGRAFERVDYKKLEGVVVWAEPRDGQKFVPAQTSASEGDAVASVHIDSSARPKTQMAAVSVGGALRLINETSRSMKVYSVTEGNEFSLALAPKSNKEWSPKATGPVEVLVSGVDDPIAIVYVTPSPWVTVARGGDVVRFAHMPPGHYEVGSWHARLPGTRSAVSLTQGQVTVDHVTVGVDALQR